MTFLTVRKFKSSASTRIGPAISSAPHWRRWRPTAPKRGRQDVWNIFKLRILDPMFWDTMPMPYNDLVKELKLRTPRQAINLLAAPKRVFERHIRTAIAVYAVEP